VQLSRSLDQRRLNERRSLLRQFDQLRTDLDVSGSMEAMDRFGQQAFDLLLGRRAQQAFDLSRESAIVRDRYGKHLWCQQALIARRLVEAGVRFVAIYLRYHTAPGPWGTPGANLPPLGGRRP